MVQWSRRCCCNVCVCCVSGGIQMVRILFFCLTALAGVSFADSAYGSENLRESCADLVLNGLGGRKWLACSASGPLTDAIAERAAQRGIELHIAPLGGKAYDAPSYGTFISGVKALGSPRLTAAAAYGGGAAFVRVWRTFSGDEVMKTFGFISSPPIPSFRDVAGRQLYAVPPTPHINSRRVTCQDWLASHSSSDFLSRKSAGVKSGS